MGAFDGKEAFGNCRCSDWKTRLATGEDDKKEMEKLKKERSEVTLAKD